MSSNKLWNRLPRTARLILIAAVALLVLTLASGSLPLGLICVAAFGAFGYVLHSSKVSATPQDIGPFDGPPAFRATLAGMARMIDPAREPILPADPQILEVAGVQTDPEGLERLVAEKLPEWRWALFTSVLLQRRNAIQPRLRDCALGYQPGAGNRLGGQEYSQLAWQAMNEVADLVQQMEQFMLSPAFLGAFGTPGDSTTADAGSIKYNAHRLMDDHEKFLRQAERCLQTPVEREVIVFAQDTGTFAMCPLVGYDDFIATMCDRVAEMQDLLPHGGNRGTIALDDANLKIDLPDGLMERITQHINRYNP